MTESLCSQGSPPILESIHSREVVGFPPLSNPQSIEPRVIGSLSHDAVDLLAALCHEGAAPADQGPGSAMTDGWRREVSVDRTRGVIESAYWVLPLSSEPATTVALHELRVLIAKANSESFRFDLSEFDHDDPPVLMRFDALDFLSPCASLGPTRGRRKLVVVVPVCAQGVDIRNPSFPYSGFSTSVDVGTVVACPSWLEWGVAHLPAEEFCLLAAWVHGPPFR